MATATKRAAKKKAAPAKRVAPIASDATYMLRTCLSDMSSYNGFVWPTSGSVTCVDWSSRKACGNGLHGLLHGVIVESTDSYFDSFAAPECAADARELKLELTPAVTS